MITGKELNLTLKECQILMKGTVCQFRKAGKDIYNKGYYIRGRSHGRPADGGLPCAKDCFCITEEKTIKNLFYNTVAHRANTIIKEFKNGTLHEIDSAIFENYKTNGKSTIAGMRRCAVSKERLQKISRSHADYLGNEINSAHDHNVRVNLRNN